MRTGQLALLASFLVVWAGGIHSQDSWIATSFNQPTSFDCQGDAAWFNSRFELPCEFKEDRIMLWNDAVHFCLARQSMILSPQEFACFNEEDLVKLKNLTKGNAVWLDLPGKQQRFHFTFDRPSELLASLEPRARHFVFCEADFLHDQLNFEWIVPHVQTAVVFLCAAGCVCDIISILPLANQCIFFLETSVVRLMKKKYRRNFLRNKLLVPSLFFAFTARLMCNALMLVAIYIRPRWKSFFGSLMTFEQSMSVGFAYSSILSAMLFSFIAVCLVIRRRYSSRSRLMTLLPFVAITICSIAAFLGYPSANRYSEVVGFYTYSEHLSPTSRFFAASLVGGGLEALVCVITVALAKFHIGRYRHAVPNPLRSWAFGPFRVVLVQSLVRILIVLVPVSYLTSGPSATRFALVVIEVRARQS